MVSELKYKPIPFLRNSFNAVKSFLHILISYDLVHYIKCLQDVSVILLCSV
jgi:hypothetical protein